MRWGALVLTAGCDRILGLSAIHPPDAAINTLSCAANLAAGDFSAHQPIVPGNVMPSPSLDELVMYLVHNGSLEYSTYAGTWSPPTTATALDDPPSFSDHPSLSYDASHIFMTRAATSTSNAAPYESSKAGPGEVWGPVTAVVFPSVFLGGDVAFGIPTADGTRVLVSHGVSGHYSLSELALVDGAWTVLDTTAALYPPTKQVSDGNGQLSPDGCWMVFNRIDRAVDVADHDIWFALRATDGTFEAPQKLFTNPSLQNEQHPWLSVDGARLYYFDQNDGSTYLATRR